MRVLQFFFKGDARNLDYGLYRLQGARRRAQSMGLLWAHTSRHVALTDAKEQGLGFRVGV